MNPHNEGPPELNDDPLLAEMLSPLKHLEPPLETRIANRQAVSAALSSFYTLNRVVPWWRRSISIPVPLAAALVLLLAAALYSKLRSQPAQDSTGVHANAGAFPKEMVLDRNELTPDSLISHIPPKVEGIVLEVSDKDLIEISIGADDGLKIGDSLEVYRGNSYLGRIVIKKTNPDRAVGQIKKELQRGQIKRGDRVTTTADVGLAVTFYETETYVCGVGRVSSESYYVIKD